MGLLVSAPERVELPRDLADGSPYTAAELIAGLSRKLEGCTVRWECTGGPCFGIIVAADVRSSPCKICDLCQSWRDNPQPTQRLACIRDGSPRRYVLITEPDDHYSSAEIPAHPWFGAHGAYAVAYFDDGADESHGCRPQIGWEQHDHASRLAADAARWLLDAELPRTAQKL